jgi:phosphoribosylformylglycinamidine cyclo-ligase
VLGNPDLTGAVKGIAHISGGGLVENLPRVLPEGMQAVVDRSTWQLPEVFQWLREQGRIEDIELLRTFNCGIGMVLVVDPTRAQSVMDALGAEDETAWPLGALEPTDGPPLVRFES